jgi:hypothetical protein
LEKKAIAFLLVYPAPQFNDKGVEWEENWTPPWYLIWLMCMAVVAAIANCPAVIGKHCGWK